MTAVPRQRMCVCAQKSGLNVAIADRINTLLAKRGADLMDFLEKSVTHSFYLLLLDKCWGMGTSDPVICCLVTKPMRDFNGGEDY